MAGSRLDTVVIFGVGLIGGSFALALKAAGAAKRVVGLGRNPANLRARARSSASSTQRATDPAAVAGADLVLIATPVGQMGAVMGAIAPHLRAGTVVTDGGSTKQDVVALAYRLLKGRAAQFVPGHPIAGAEHSGVAAAPRRSVPQAQGGADPAAREQRAQHSQGARRLAPLRRQTVSDAAGRT